MYLLTTEIEINNLLLFFDTTRRVCSSSLKTCQLDKREAETL